MTDRLPDLIDAFAGRKILVIGDVILDGYLEGQCSRVCPEAPVPVVNLGRLVAAPGGAANVAANARALGAAVKLLGVMGDDHEAEQLIQVLCDNEVSPEGIERQSGRRTLCKRRVTAAGQVICRLDQGDTNSIAEETEARLIGQLEDLWIEADAIIISDYGYGVLTSKLIGTLSALQKQFPRLVAGDSKRLAALRGIGLTAVKPNYPEALRLLNLDAEPCRSRMELMTTQGPRVLEQTGARIAAVTLDTEGALIFERGRPPYRTYADAHPHCRASGAGDTYVACLTLALAAQGDTYAAAELAAAASAVVVEKDGTASCSVRELRERVAGSQKVTDREGAIVRLVEERQRGRRVVLTNGCFDILHRGHVTYLARAKALGDLLVVGVNTDTSIRRLKGPTRPINALEDRLHVLAALSCVDLIVPFDETTPHELIRAVRPDVFVKGGDYTRDRLPEAGLVEEFGGAVRILPFVADRSTTALIEKIRADRLAGIDGRVS